MKTKGKGGGGKGRGEGEVGCSREAGRNVPSQNLLTAWWLTPAIQALRRLRQQDCWELESGIQNEFQASQSPYSKILGGKTTPNQKSYLQNYVGFLSF